MLSVCLESRQSHHKSNSPLKQKHNIISVGAHAEINWLRDAVLQSAGFTVLNTSDENTAFAKIKEGHCDVLLLYYRLREGLAERLATAFRESCPNGTIVVVSNRATEKPNFADTLLYKVEGPEALIDAIRNQ
jgi:DNA-binding NtrC family response regulator